MKGRGFGSSLFYLTLPPNCYNLGMSTPNQAEEIAQKILDKQSVPTILDGHHGQAIERALRQHGAKEAKSHSSCKVASFESHLKLPDGRTVHLVNSNFMGSFTDIEVWAS
jgi:hypothetical protein